MTIFEKIVQLLEEIKHELISYNEKDKTSSQVTNRKKAVKRYLRCPECLGYYLIKYGVVYRKEENEERIKKQQYQCKDCGRVTIKPIREK